MSRHDPADLDEDFEGANLDRGVMLDYARDQMEYEVSLEEQELGRVFLPVDEGPVAYWDESLAAMNLDSTPLCRLFLDDKQQLDRIEEKLDKILALLQAGDDGK